METVDNQIIKNSSYEPHSFEVNTVLKADDMVEMDAQIYNNLSYIKHLTENKQDKLVSGSNIKTINDEDIVGEGNIDIINNIKIGNYSTEISDNTGEADITEALKNELKDSYGIDYKSINYNDISASGEDSNIVINNSNIKLYGSLHNENVFEAKMDYSEELNDEFFEKIYSESDEEYPYSIEGGIIAPKLFNDTSGIAKFDYKNNANDYFHYIYKTNKIVENNDVKRLIHEFVIDKNDKILEYSLDNIKLAIGFDKYESKPDNGMINNIADGGNLYRCNTWNIINTKELSFYIERVELDYNDKEIKNTTTNITDFCVQSTNEDDTLDWKSNYRSMYLTPFSSVSSSDDNYAYTNMHLFSNGPSIKISHKDALNFKNKNKLKIKIYINIPNIKLITQPDLSEYINYLIKFKCNFTKTHKNFATFLKDSVIIKKDKSLFSISDDGIEMRSAYASENGAISDSLEYETIKNSFYGIKVSPHGIFINPDGYETNAYININDWIDQKISEKVGD